MYLSHGFHPPTRRHHAGGSQLPPGGPQYLPACVLDSVVQWTLVCAFFATHALNSKVQSILNEKFQNLSFF